MSLIDLVASSVSFFGFLQPRTGDDFADRRSLVQRATCADETHVFSVITISWDTICSGVSAAMLYDLGDDAYRETRGVLNSIGSCCATSRGYGFASGYRRRCDLGGGVAQVFSFAASVATLIEGRKITLS